MKIGFIGLGLMGSGMAANIARAGYGLSVHDLNRAAAEPLLADGAHWAETLADLGSQSDVVLTSLPKPSDVRVVAEALVPALRPGTIWLDLSTNALDVVKTIHAMMVERGSMFLDAPVSGGPAGAASGKLAIWVGGDRAAFDKVFPLLNAMADRARYTGDVGAGTVSKLVHNTIATTINHSVAEMMTVGVKAGMDPLELFEAIRSGAMGRMRAFDGVAPRWLVDNLDPPTFALELLHKDVALGVGLAEQVGAPAPLATLARDDLAEALNKGQGRRDAQAALLLKQERAGIDPIKVSPDDLRAVMDRT